jgi:predicted RNase H-like nuclease (RuvC/YqgF family)
MSDTEPTPDVRNAQQQIEPNAPDSDVTHHIIRSFDDISDLDIKSQQILRLEQNMTNISNDMMSLRQEFLKMKSSQDTAQLSVTQSKISELQLMSENDILRIQLQTEERKINHFENTSDLLFKEMNL